MSSIEIELILNGPRKRRELSLAAHVNKYLENIIYSKRIQEAACPLDYFENESINADRNIFIFDKSFLANSNKKDLSLFKKKFNQVDSKTIVTAYKEILVTNKLAVSKEGKELPLFYRHKLKNGTKEVDIEIVTNKDEELLGSYLIDLDDNSIYTNYKNEFDLETGKYRLFIIHSVDSENNATKEIMNLSSIVGEVSWEDIDLETGTLKKGTVGYSKEENSTGYTFRMTGDGPWYWKPKETSSIFLKKPSEGSSKDNWNIKVTNGEIKNYSNGQYKKYWIPEFAQQAFSPFAPYSFMSYDEAYFVNKKALNLSRNKTGILPEKQMHLEVICFDESERIIEVYTTDISKSGNYFENTDVIYKTEGIESWDNSSGIVIFSEELESRYSYKANYFFELEEYEMKEISFNPLQNKDIKNYNWVIYCIPDLSYDEKSIHYLGVDKEGIIRFVSQGLSRNHPSFKLKQQDNSLNPGTLIGKKYYSSRQDEFSFTRDYSSLSENEFQYLILGEIGIMEKELQENSFFVDVREKERNIKKNKIESVIRRNPKILQSQYGYGEQGQEYSRNNVLIYEIPITVLKEFGGIFSEEDIEDILKKSAPASKKIIIDYEYKVPSVKIDNTEPLSVSFELSWEGQNLKYNIYRKLKKEKEFNLIATIENPTGPVLFKDEEVERNIYYYKFSIVENEIEYPKSNLFSIQVK